MSNEFLIDVLNAINQSASRIATALERLVVLEEQRQAEDRAEHQSTLAAMKAASAEQAAMAERLINQREAEDAEARLAADDAIRGIFPRSRNDD